MDDNELSLTLGREELLLLMHLMGLQTIPGLEEEPLARLTEAQVEATMVAAEHSLLARGLIRHASETSEEVEVDAIAAALVSSGLRARASFMVARARPDEAATTRYYHLLSHDPYLAVEHGSPEPGLHTFRAMKDRAQVLARWESLLNLQDQPAPPAPGGGLTEEALLQARQAAVEREEDAVVQEYLRNGGLRADTAASLASTLLHLLSESSVIRVDLEREGEVAGFALLEGRDGLWLLPMQQNTSTSIRVLPLSADDVRAWLRKTINIAIEGG